MWPEPTPEQERRIACTLGGNAAFHNWHNDFSHIIDPNERRRLALSEIDKVPFGWYHVRAISVAGIGFFTDSYDIFAINFTIQMLGLAFWPANGGIMTSNVSSALKAATSGGAVIGQIGFGILADILGRRRMYGVELVTIIASTLAQSLSSPSHAMTLTGLLVFWRVIMGIGVGGDYPMSAIITSEYVLYCSCISKFSVKSQDTLGE
jgi:PHS family inorganic phosphate transporter-like MFS transporter